MPGDISETNLNKFISSVKEILPGSNFSVFEKLQKGTDSTFVQDWTDLTGYQKRLLLQRLPEKYVCFRLA